ncbi:MAG: enoyl-CoA hydratase-related protein [Desulfobacterales bacterium]|jgi:2-(1,2-epoxy-1,2-dihydrophenyl)acetyl-CoA isomerase|nr:enoyl-CoA hydratase-related protein [Desulfobacterales bacterium]
MRTAVRLDIKGGIAEVVLVQAKRGNPLDENLCGDLCDVANECSENPGVRAVLIRADGKYFSVGADLKWFGRDRVSLPLMLKRANSKLHMAIARFVRADAPVVIAIHALVVGGMTALTAMADFALAGTSAKFYAAYNLVGFAPDGAGTYFIPRRVGSRKAAEFLMLNQTWTAEEAARNGLITRVVPDDRLLEEARSLVEEIAGGPTITFGETKRLLMSYTDQPMETQMELEAQAIARCAHTDDCWNAIQAVMHKKPIEFKGR